MEKKILLNEKILLLDLKEWLVEQFVNHCLRMVMGKIMEVNFKPNSKRIRFIRYQRCKKMV